MPMSSGWARYHPTVALLPVRDGFGNTVLLTPNQHRILIVGRSLEGEKVSAGTIAASIGVATSTVTRALTRLAAYGLVAYDTAKGRYGGITFIATAWADLKARSKRAWGRIRQDRDRAWDRYIGKLERTGYFWSGLNVASYREQDATLESGG